MGVMLNTRDQGLIKPLAIYTLAKRQLFVDIWLLCALCLTVCACTRGESEVLKSKVADSQSNSSLSVLQEFVFEWHTSDDSAGWIKLPVIDGEPVAIEHQLMIEAHIVNLSSETKVAFSPSIFQTLTISSDADILADRGLIGSIAFDEYSFHSISFGQASIGIIDLGCLINATEAENGWYECTFLYDDDGANANAIHYESKVRSVVGKLSVPPLEIQIEDGNPVAWRLSEKDVSVRIDSE